MSERRRRGLRAAVLILLALACGGFAAAQVRGRTAAVERELGPRVPVVVATADLPPDFELAPDGHERRLEVREVPVRYAPADALASPEDALGQRTAVAVPAGTYVTAGQLRSPGAPGGPAVSLAPGERAVELDVAAGAGLAGLEGGRVDVLVTTEPRSGPGRTFLALEAAELLAVGPGEGDVGRGDDGAAPAGGGARATLRVSLRQAVFLTAAQNFAREVRLLPRSPRDRHRAGRTEVDAETL